MLSVDDFRTRLAKISEIRSKKREQERKRHTEKEEQIQIEYDKEHKKIFDEYDDFLKGE